MINSKVELLTITTFRCQGLRVLFAVNKETIHGTHECLFCGTTDTHVLLSALGFKARMDLLASVPLHLHTMDPPLYVHTDRRTPY